MIFGFVQVLLEILRTVGKHVLDTPVEEVFLLDSFLVCVFQLVFRYLFDNFTLVVGHGLEDEGKTKLLVVILG